MIGPSGAVRVLVATKPVDFRKGAEGLVALVREEMRVDPFGGAIFVFRAKRADRIKLIFWDGTGLCLYAKRLPVGETGGANGGAASRGPGCRASIETALPGFPVSARSWAEADPKCAGGGAPSPRPRSGQTSHAAKGRLFAK